MLQWCFQSGPFLWCKQTPSDSFNPEESKLAFKVSNNLLTTLVKEEDGVKASNTSKIIPSSDCFNWESQGHSLDARFVVVAMASS
mmetsp:Transcript_20683/g.44715  ORF Transcript_20683/g.44715 Transcript_20683/m.44715 type:complete len:85 (+) Transcript_20683:2532-2786(+)